MKISKTVKTLALIALSLCGMRVAAQSIPNASFENWTTKSNFLGSTTTLDDWYGMTFKLASSTVDASKPAQSKDAYDGTYAATISSSTMNRLVATAVRAFLVAMDTTGVLDSLLDVSKPSPGIFTNATISPVPFLVTMLQLSAMLSDSTLSLSGTAGLNTLLSFVSTADFGAMFNGGLGVHGVPHRLTGYYKYSVGSNMPDSADQGAALMLCLATDTTDTAKGPTKVLTGGGLSLLKAASEYTRFSLDYIHFADYYPDTVVFIFLSSLNDAVNGTQLTVDKLDFSYYNVDTVKELTMDSALYDRAFFHWARSKSFLWQIAYGPTGLSVDSMEVFSSSQPKCTLTGLSPQTTYDLYVRSMFGLNMYGPWTPVCTFTTPKEPCDTVRAFKAVRLSDTSALLQWGADLSRGFTYHLQCALSGDTVLFVDTLLQSDTFALPSLLPDTDYVAMLQVICPDTVSAWQKVAFRLQPEGAGIREREGNWHVAVYPNPTQGSFFVEIPEGEKVHMTVYSLSGQCVLRQDLSESRTSCRLPGPGSYFIRLSSEKGSLVQKIVALP